MAFANAALHHLFAWRPLSRQARLGVVDRMHEASPATDVALGDRPAERRRGSGSVPRTVAADLRQCEPWRQSALLDAAARNDATRHDRLTR
jgi:hypothetical protein